MKLAGNGGTSGSHIPAGAGKPHLRSTVASLAYFDGQLFVATTEGMILEFNNLAGYVRTRKGLSVGESTFTTVGSVMMRRTNSWNAALERFPSLRGS
jgi:hypothetical protein